MTIVCSDGCTNVHQITSQVGSVPRMSAVLPKVVSMVLLGGVSLLVGCLPIAVVKKMGWDSAEDFNHSKRAQGSLK